MYRLRNLAALCLFLCIASITLIAEAQRPLATRGNLAELERLMLGLPSTNSYVHPGWRVEFQPVPALVRMHCRLLKPEQGLVVGRVHRNSPSAMYYDLRFGDIVMSVGGQEVMGLATLPAMPGAELVVVRAGEEISLEPRVNVNPTPRQGPGRDAHAGISTHAGQYDVSASSFASGNESVSVAKNGRQLSVKMSLPDLQSAPIAFKGTRQQILDQVKSSTLSPAAKQRVLEAIR
jgi:hypothetical protein